MRPKTPREKMRAVLEHLAVPFFIYLVLRYGHGGH